MESTPVGQLMGQIYDLKQLVENLRNQMGQLCEVQNELQKVVTSKIQIKCPVENCPKTFTTRSHCNRHVNNWVDMKRGGELWEEHLREYEKLTGSSRQSAQPSAPQPPNPQYFYDNYTLDPQAGEIFENADMGAEFPLQNQPNAQNYQNHSAMANNNNFYFINHA
ncbi:hypothetical protein F5Y02DRAFT_425001 [Annulohypoxylon stygium]|nr:hypothetical protein F5Y02DRAFT_425001 [Annulohypoxylon stygium]